MKTDDLIKVMRDNRKLIRVELDSKLTEAAGFWSSMTVDVYVAILDNPLDMDVRDVMQEFARVDSLELVNKSGRLLKRFAKYFKESKGYKLPDSTAGLIGDKLQYYISQESKVYYIDFTDSIDWEDGQFGKSNSCWWGTYSESVPSYEGAGGWGIRFYRDENQNNDNGIGRTWVFPKDNMLMCFNSYGIERPNVSKVIKQVYKQAGVILHYKTVELYNSNNSDIPYINSGTGFVLFPEGIDPESLDEKYDLDIYAERDERDERDVCYDCGDRIDEGEGYFVNGEIYCESCCNDQFAFCDKCDEYCDRDDVHEIVNHRRYSYLCRYCAESIGAALCKKCDNYSEDYIVTEDTSETYCTDCANDECYYCESCDEWNMEEHNHEEEESLSESTSDDEIEMDFISFELEKISISQGSYSRPNTKEHTTMVYRHALIPGLFVWQDSNDELWNIAHESSGFAVWTSVPSLYTALEGLSRLQGLCDWTQSKESITSNQELRNKTLEIRRELS